MDNRDLLKIIQLIEEKEDLNLSEIAEKARLDRSNLSTFLNLTDPKEVSPRMRSRFASAFPTYFKASIQNNKTNTTDIEGITIIDFKNPKGANAGDPGRDIESKLLELGNIKVTVADYINLQQQYINLQQENIDLLKKGSNSGHVETALAEIMRTIRVDNAEMKKGLQELQSSRPEKHSKA